MTRRHEVLEGLGLTAWRLRTSAAGLPSSENGGVSAVDVKSAELSAPVVGGEAVVDETPSSVLNSPVIAGAEAEEQVVMPARKSPLRDSVEEVPHTVAAAETVALPSTERALHIAQLAWADFDADVSACTACGLCKSRTRAVPGVGDVQARWLFVGEGPGAEEDKKGEPFVGQAGRLLDQMLAALGLKRGEGVYIANVLKCRPPGNRAPTPQEADACRPYLERQIALIQPELIVALGKSAATLLLNNDASIASLRGRVHHYREVPLVVTYHPAYLLRSPADKEKSWEDLVFAKRQLAKVEQPA